MARYLVERTFPDGLAIPVNNKGAQVCLTVVGNNAVDGVTWVHSYVTIPAFYELHVWAWKNNPSGMFTDWNPNVSCEDYREDGTTEQHSHQ
jgi:hypothetical protein